MMCSLKVLSCLLLVMLDSGVNGGQDCAAITCPPQATVKSECKDQDRKTILFPNQTNVCCTYCVKILSPGEPCTRETGKEPLVARCMIGCDTKTNKCIVPLGSKIEPVEEENQGSSMFKIKATLLESSLWILSLASILYLAR